MTDSRPSSDYPSVAELLERVPEVYQPVYGHPVAACERPLHDGRFDTVLNTVRGISAHERRLLRVLDLGCAQGFLSLALAADGHSVIGLDYEPANINLCEALRRENSLANLAFLHRDLADATDLLAEGFDVVIGLSVFHHLAHRDGYISARNLADDIRRRSRHGLFEFALRTEPLYWAASQPVAPRDWISGYPFIVQIGESPTHLSDVRRPLFFASHSLALTSRGFEQWQRASQTRPDFRPPDDTRRYFFFGDRVMKVVSRFSEAADPRVAERHQMEMQREAAFITSRPPELTASLEVLKLTTHADEAVLERTLVAGTPLSECAGSLSVSERLSVSESLLRQLADLESLDLYHGDIRPWNVLVEPEGSSVTLIDFGSISDRAQDAVPHLDPMLATVFTLVSVWFDGKLTADGMPELPGCQSHLVLPPQPLCAIDTLCSHPGASRPFARALEAFERSAGNPNGVAVGPAVQWIIELGRQASIADARGRELEHDLRTVCEEVEALNGRCQALLQEKEALVDAANEMRTRSESAQSDLRRELDGVYGSRSWRLTRFLRSSVRHLRGTR